MGEADVIVKYVRREMRSLNAADKAEFLDAAQVLWNVSTEDGQTLYGSNYLSAESITSMHGNLAAEKGCDAIHDGLGFFNSHVALTNIFEQSLQAVNPKVALPYW